MISATKRKSEIFAWAPRRSIHAIFEAPWKRSWFISLQWTHFPSSFFYFGVCWHTRIEFPFIPCIWNNKYDKCVKWNYLNSIWQSTIMPLIKIRMRSERNGEGDKVNDGRKDIKFFRVYHCYLYTCLLQSSKWAAYNIWNGFHSSSHVANHNIMCGVMCVRCWKTFPKLGVACSLQVKSNNNLIWI